MLGRVGEAAPDEPTAGRRAWIRVARAKLARLHRAARKIGLQLKEAEDRVEDDLAEGQASMQADPDQPEPHRKGARHRPAR
jgi:hypothetical protein